MPTIISRGAMSAKAFGFTNKSAPIITCATYTTAGTYSWIVPSGVTSVAALAIGGGGGAGNRQNGGGPGGGGALAYVNNISVTPGETLTVIVGYGGPGWRSVSLPPINGCDSYLKRSTTNLVGAGGGKTSGGSGYVIVGTGGSGGAGGSVGGGGAGGYAGTGGAGAYCGGNGGNGFGGGGGGGGSGGSSCGGGQYLYGSGGGGGTGIYGQGSNGVGGTYNSSGTASAATGGSGGGTGSTGYIAGGTGGNYGGGGGIGGFIACGCTLVCNGWGGYGQKGAVRIVWAGGSRGTPSFPSTNVGA